MHFRLHLAAFKSALLLGSFLLCIAPATATIVTADFGTGANVQSAFPAWDVGNNLSGGVTLTSPLFLDQGEIHITATGGALTCAVSITPGLCANSLAYGLGVTGGSSDARLDPGETIVLTLVNSNYTVRLISFVITGFSQGVVIVDGNPGSGFDQAGGFTFLVPGSPVINTNVVWSIPVGNTGHYSLAQITMDITLAPEPSTFAMLGAALVGMGAVASRRRIRDRLGK